MQKNIRPPEPKRWYERWQAQIAGATTVVVAVGGLLSASDGVRKTVARWFNGQSAIVQPIEYKNSAKNAEDILTSFKLPTKLSIGLCSDMFARGNSLRASIPTMTEIQDHLDDLSGNKSDVEKHNASTTGALWQASGADSDSMRSFSMQERCFTTWGLPISTAPPMSVSKSTVQTPSATSCAITALPNRH
jgi:hypothetical protein